MILPSPTRPLESLDMHVYMDYAAMLRAVPVAERPEVRHLVLRLNSHRELNDNFETPAGRTALNNTIRYYRGLRTLSIIVDSSQPIFKRNNLQSRGSSIITSLRAADLPDLGSLVLESSRPMFFADLQGVHPMPYRSATTLSSRIMLTIRLGNSWLPRRPLPTRHCSSSRSLLLKICPVSSVRIEGVQRESASPKRREQDRYFGRNSRRSIRLLWNWPATFLCSLPSISKSSIKLQVSSSSSSYTPAM